ncbi:zinc ribbon domain-containing protein, partial [Acinetobacter baumannii]
SAIPNRIYSRQLPVINSRSKNGAFEGEILEETQPVPINTLRDMTLSSCFKEEKYRWLAILNSFGLLSFIASVVLMTIFAKGLYNGSYLDFS